MCRIAAIIGVAVISVSTALALPGSGTESDPWRIESIEDFNDFAADPNYWDDCTRLETDVNLTGLTYTTAVIAPDTSTDSGFQGTAFTGVFDGNDHKVTGLRIDAPQRWKCYVGLFGYVEGGRISALGLEGCAVSGGDLVGGLVGQNDIFGIISNCCCTGTVTGEGYVTGGLVGCNDGFVLGCYSSGSVSGGEWVGGLAGENYGVVASNCCSVADVSGDAGIGGLVGANRSAYSYEAVISKCRSMGHVAGDYLVGGIVGENMGGCLSSCSSVCSVSGTSQTGGIVGHNSWAGSVSCCSSTGSVTGEEHVGGLLGWNELGSVSGCWSAGDVNGIVDVGGLVGANSHRGSVQNCFWDTDIQTHGVTESIGLDEGTAINVAGLATTEMQTQSTFTSAGWDFLGESANGTSETWQMPPSGGYPALSFLCGFAPPALSGSGTEADPYLIGDPNGLGMVRWYPQDSCFKLTSDIDLSGINWSVSIVPVFRGSFDGDGHKLINMHVSGGGYLGMFGYLGMNAHVTNLGLEGGCVLGSGGRVGGIVACNYGGSLSDCYSTADITGYYLVGGLVGDNVGGALSACHARGDVSGEWDSVGGLVGYDARGTLSDCYAAGNVKGGGLYTGGLVGGTFAGDLTSCHSIGDVTGYRIVGGLVGDNGSGGLSNCYSAGSVRGEDWIGGLVAWNTGSLWDCYSTGGVSGWRSVGGLIARGYGGFVSYCYSIGDVNGIEHVGGLVGSLDEGIVWDCFWDTETQTHGVTAGIGYDDGWSTRVVGLPTAQMQTRSTFTDAGWDFVETWDLMCEGMNYPRFVWQIAPVDFACAHGVNWGDYSFFADRWMDANCGDADDCDGADVDFSGTVDAKDLAILCDYWLAMYFSQ